MIRARKARAVGGFEFFSTVKRPGWLFATFGMPLMLGFWGLIGLIPGFFIAMKENETRIYGVVDKPGVMRLSGDVAAPLPELPEEAKAALERLGQSSAADEAIAKGNAVFRPFASEEQAHRELLEDTLAGYYVLEEDYFESGKVKGYIREGGPFGGGGAGDQFKEMLKERLIEGRVPAEVAARVRTPVASSENFNVSADGEISPRSVKTEIARFVLPLAFSILLFSALMGTAGYLLQAVAIEKENRVVEVLLSSATPDEILAGKLFGLGAAGLLQIAVWIAMIGVFAAGAAGMLVSAGIPIPWLALGLAIPFFLAAYFFTGSLMLGFSSLGATMREAQQWSLVLTLPTVVPLMMTGVLLAEPHGIFARVMSLIPFTAPLTLMMRAALDPAGLPWWEIALALGVMVLSTIIALKVGSRLFRVGMLLTGTRPSLRQILRQAGLVPGRG